MTILCMAGLVWLGCAAVVVLGLCVAAHGAPPSMEECEVVHAQFTSDLTDHNPDFLRKAA